MWEMLYKLIYKIELQTIEVVFNKPAKLIKVVFATKLGLWLGKHDLGK